MRLSKDYSQALVDGWIQKFGVSRAELLEAAKDVKPCAPIPCGTVDQACPPWTEAKFDVTHVYEHCEACGGTGRGLGVSYEAGVYVPCDACGGYGAIAVPVGERDVR